MVLLEEVLKKEFNELDQNGVRLRAIGRLEMLPPAPRESLEQTMAKLEKNDRLTLTLALSYGGRAEIVDASRRLAEDVRRGAIVIEDIDEAVFRRFLYDSRLPDPDLVVRTSGEMRVSNFMLWQIAYAEILVTDVLWPDFREKELLDSIEAYQKRERRYGL
jgi:undecaprenyl diphosphate synthase